MNEMNEMKEVKEVKEVKENNPKNRVVIDKAKIISVTSPEVIKNFADSFGTKPTEVFVRVVFEVDSKQYVASNKLKFLTKVGYNELLEAKEKGTTLKLSIDTEKGFFYIVKDVKVDDLFGTIAEKKASGFSDLASLLG